MSVKNKNYLTVILKDDTQTLDEVVVVGFSTQKKINLTGAVENVSSDVFENRPVANVTQMLQGAVPNLNISLADGKPNQSASYNIRGVTSIGAGGSALVLIDGVEGDPAMLNPNDIESVSVLKDAASAAIYGSRAPYGVVLITTKDPSKQKDKFTINYTGNFSYETPYAIPDVVDDGYVWAYLFREAEFNYRGIEPTSINKSQPFSKNGWKLSGRESWQATHCRQQLDLTESILTTGMKITMMHFIKIIHLHSHTMYLSAVRTGKSVTTLPPVCTITMVCSIITRTPTVQ
ncbi:TonB-dependent receptor plug domain-containing protein [Bacteroides sp. CR5/BHMF/2]|nr:TonB-dependent receptor plug domain-containing protein [Bacteroides sp. CR5/BHMF/2]